MPDDMDYIPASEGDEDPHFGHEKERYHHHHARDEEQSGRRSPPGEGKEKKDSFLGGIFSDGLGGIFKRLKLDGMDRGDILLLLIVLFLVLESDDHLEIVITLGILLFMGFGGEGEKEDR